MYRIGLYKIWERKTDTKTEKMNNGYHEKFELNNLEKKAKNNE